MRTIRFARLLALLVGLAAAAVPATNSVDVSAAPGPTPPWKILVLIYEHTDFSFADGANSRRVVADLTAEETAFAAFEAAAFVGRDIPALDSRQMRPALEIRYPVQTLPDLLIPQEGDCPELRVNLRDTGAGARVVVRLVALSIFPGSGTGVTTLGTIDSNAAAISGDPTQYRAYKTCLNRLPPNSEFLIDRAFFAYYVEAQLTKTTSTGNPGLMSVQICPSQDACDP